MADVFEAYRVLNETLNLGLNIRDIARAEAVYKNRLATSLRGPIQGNLYKDWELISYLVPRQSSLSEDANRMLEDLQREMEPGSPK